MKFGLFVVATISVALTNNEEAKVTAANYIRGGTGTTSTSTSSTSTGVAKKKPPQQQQKEQKQQQQLHRNNGEEDVTVDVNIGQLVEYVKPAEGEVEQQAFLVNIGNNNDAVENNVDAYRGEGEVVSQEQRGEPYYDGTQIGDGVGAEYIQAGDASYLNNNDAGEYQYQGAGDEIGGVLLVNRPQGGDEIIDDADGVGQYFDAIKDVGGVRAVGDGFGQNSFVKGSSVGEVVDIQAGDGVDIQIYTNSKEGTEVVQINSVNNNNNVILQGFGECIENISEADCYSVDGHIMIGDHWCCEVNNKISVQDEDGLDRPFFANHGTQDVVGGCIEDVSDDDCSSADGHMVGDYCCGATRDISTIISSGDDIDISSIPSIPSSDVNGAVGGCIEDVSDDDCSSADGHMVGDYCCGATRDISISSGDIPSVPSIPSSGDLPELAGGLTSLQQASGGINNNNKNVVTAAHKKVVQQGNNHHPQGGDEIDADGVGQYFDAIKDVGTIRDVGDGVGQNTGAGERSQPAWPVTNNNNNDKNVVTAAHKKVVQQGNNHHHNVPQVTAAGGCIESISSEDCSSADGTMVGDLCCGATTDVTSISSGDIPSVSSGDFPGFSNGGGQQMPPGGGGQQTPPGGGGQQTPGGPSNVVTGAHEKVVQAKTTNAVGYGSNNNNNDNNDKNVVTAAHEKVAIAYGSNNNNNNDNNDKNVVTAAHKKVVQAKTTNGGNSSNNKNNVVTSAQEKIQYGGTNNNNNDNNEKNVVTAAHKKVVQAKTSNAVDFGNNNNNNNDKNVVTAAHEKLENVSVGNGNGDNIGSAQKEVVQQHQNQHRHHNNN